MEKYLRRRGINKTTGCNSKWLRVGVQTGTRVVLFPAVIPPSRVYKVLNLPLSINPHQLKRIHATMAKLSLKVKFIRRPYTGQWPVNLHHIKLDPLIKAPPAGFPQFLQTAAPAHSGQ